MKLLNGEFPFSIPLLSFVSDHIFQSDHSHGVTHGLPVWWFAALQSSQCVERHSPVTCWNHLISVDHCCSTLGSRSCDRSLGRQRCCCCCCCCKDAACYLCGPLWQIFDYTKHTLRRLPCVPGYCHTHTHTQFMNIYSWFMNTFMNHWQSLNFHWVI